MRAMHREMRPAMLAGHSSGTLTLRSAPRMGMSRVITSDSRMANWKMSAARSHLSQRATHNTQAPWEEWLAGDLRV